MIYKENMKYILIIYYTRIIFTNYKIIIHFFKQKIPITVIYLFNSITYYKLKNIVLSSKPVYIYI